MKLQDCIISGEAYNGQVGLYRYDKYTDTCIFALVIIIAVYVTVTNNRRKQNLIIKKLKNGWGKPSQRKYSGEDYECISHYFKRNEDENSIDDITWNDLGMDAVFCMMNNTNSSAGQEYLYKMLRCPNADIQSLKKLDKLASDFDKNAAKRLDIQKIFVWIGRAKHISISDYCDVVVGLEKKATFFIMLQCFLFLQQLYLPAP